MAAILSRPHVLKRFNNRLGFQFYPHHSGLLKRQPPKSQGNNSGEYR